MRVRAGDGELTAKVNLGRAPEHIEPGRYLALGERRQLFVLVPHGNDRADEVAVVDTRTLGVRTRYRLKAGARYRGIVLARSGVLYAYGNEPGRLLDEASGAREEAAVVTAVDTKSGSVLATTAVRRPNGRDWWVYSGVLSSDETTLLLSYHGGCGPGFFRACTTGADRLVVSARGIAPCRTRSTAGSGCLAAVHGAVAAHEEGFIAATGSPRVLELDERGRPAGSLRTRLHTHLMQIQVEGRLLFALGSCGLGGGLSEVDIAARSARVFKNLCGERLSVGPDDLLALAANSQPVPVGAPSRLVVINRSSGREVRTVPTGLEVLDLSFLPGGP